MEEPCCEFARAFTPGKTGSCPECFPLVNSLSCSKMMDFKLFRNVLRTLPRLMGSNKCCSEVTVDVNAHLNVPDRQTKTPAFIEVLTFDPFISCILLVFPGRFNLLIGIKAVGVDFFTGL